MCLKETEKARFVQTAENVQFPEKNQQLFPCSQADLLL
jgi:hypothetical protein